MKYKNKEKIKKHMKDYYNKNKDKINKQKKEYNERHKDEIKKYHKEYNEKNKYIIKEKRKKYYEKNKDKLNKITKKYYEKNKIKLREGAKKYRKINKEKVKEKDKERGKNLYLSSIKKLCNYYEITKPFCFFDIKESPFKFELTKEEAKKQNFIIIDHKEENLTEIKDKYHGSSLERHILNSNENELTNYQLLCSRHNLDKEVFYEYYLALKEMKAEEADEIYKAYEDLFIYDKEKLHRKLREMGREDLIKEEDENNAI